MYVQLGVAIGFLLPSMLVKNHDNLDDIGQDLSVMYYSVAGFTTVLLVLILLCEYKVANLTNYTSQMQAYHHCTSYSVSATEFPAVHITPKSSNIHLVTLEFSN
jgi:hypothetical protein